MTPSVQQVPVPTLPTTQAQAPVFGASPVGQKPQAKSATPTFLNASATPGNNNSGAGKQLIGQ